MQNPTFYLLPAPLSPDSWQFIPDYALQIYHKIDYFIAENPKTARRFINQINHPLPQMEIQVHRFNKKSSTMDIDGLMQPLKNDKSIAYVSEAGSAAIADPGNRLVLWAHRHNITVSPIPGPISLMLALSASGLNGQNFHFHGYLPIKQNALSQKIDKLQAESVKNGTTHLFIETPYRAQKTFKALLTTLHPDINLCLARDLTMESQFILTQSVKGWRTGFYDDIARDSLCVFLFAAAGAGIH